MGERVECRVRSIDAWVTARDAMLKAGLKVDADARTESVLGPVTFGVTLPDEAAEREAPRAGTVAMRLDGSIKDVTRAVDEMTRRGLDVTWIGGGGCGLQLGAELTMKVPDEAAKAPGEWWADRLDARPLGTAQEERQWAMEWLRRAEESQARVAGLYNMLDEYSKRTQTAEAHAAVSLHRAKAAEERTEKAEAHAAELKATLGRVGEHGASVAAIAQEASDRAEQAEAALAAQAKQPSAGDRVRGLTIDVITSVAIGGNYSVRAVADLLPLIAAELDKQDCESQSASKAGSVVAPTAAPPACSGPVTLVFGERERYGIVSDVGLEHVAVEWLGKLSLFARTDGRCVESFDGIMRGWRIHPDDLPRFQEKPSGKRVVVAPDGTKLFVARGALGSGSFEVPEWHVTWISDELPFIKRYEECPTDAEALADYAAWKAGQK